MAPKRRRSNRPTLSTAVQCRQPQNGTTLWLVDGVPRTIIVLAMPCASISMKWHLNGTGMMPKRRPFERLKRLLWSGNDAIMASKLQRLQRHQWHQKQHQKGGRMTLGSSVISGAKTVPKQWENDARTASQCFSISRMAFPTREWRQNGVSVLFQQQHQNSARTAPWRSPTTRLNALALLPLLETAPKWCSSPTNDVWTTSKWRLNNVRMTPERRLQWHS